MSILKMTFISMVGPKEYFDDFVCKHIVNSGIQPENALGMLENVKGLKPYTDSNQYNDISKRVSTLVSSMGLDLKKNIDAPCQEAEAISIDDTLSALDAIEKELQELIAEKESLQSMLNESFHIKKQLELLGNVDVELQRFFNFEFIKFRFGRMPKKSYKQLQLYLDDLEVIVIPVTKDSEYVWIMYFTPQMYREKVDGILSSLYFERTRISGELNGTPKEALEYLENRIDKLEEDLAKAEENIRIFISKNTARAFELYYLTQKLNRIIEVKKYAAHTTDSFYIIGWIPKVEFKKLQPILDSYNNISYILEEPDLLPTIKPPSELKNNVLFRPFETLVRMYGLPSYNEIDPTTFVAITYFIMFGFMFGDVGQGIALLLLGAVLMKARVSLGGVIAGAGISSTLFGFIYGSVFGFEDWIPALWISPLHNINTMLITGIVIGLVLITVSMLLNIFNGIKSKDLARVLFDRNGVAGFVFYWSIILFVLYFMQTGRVFISYGFIAFFLLIPITAIFFKHPMENLFHKKPFLPKNKGGFFVETFFELFETVLSFVSNTISFIRLSAFALNHAGLFMAVLLLAGMAQGIGSLIEIILGNIIIVALEGLIVGIQALRLEYYELFGRFFTGGGREYSPIKSR